MPGFLKSFRYLVLLILCGATSTAVFAQQISPEEKAMRQEIFLLINQKRSIYNQPALLSNDTLHQIARKHSIAMAEGKRAFGHDYFASRDSLIRIYWRKTVSTAENVTIAENAEEAVESWWTSEGHKENLLGDFTHTGIGLAKKGNLWYCTQIFKR